MNDSCVLNFLAGLAFLEKPLFPNLPNREKKVWTEAFLPIPEQGRAIMYTVGCIRVEVASPREGERATLAILVWPQTLACFFLVVSVFFVVSHIFFFLFEMCI